MSSGHARRLGRVCVAMLIDPDAMLDAADAAAWQRQTSKSAWLEGAVSELQVLMGYSRRGLDDGDLAVGRNGWLIGDDDFSGRAFNAGLRALTERAMGDGVDPLFRNALIDSLLDTADRRGWRIVLTGD